MSHTVSEKDRLIRRVQRVMGQLDAIKRALEDDHECSEIMHLISAARGGVNSLMAEVVEDHILEHMVEPNRRRSSAEHRAAQDLVEIVRAYVR